MAVTHTTVGFKGQVGQSDEARRMARLGPRFAVGSATEWAVTAAAGDRTVAISPGSGQCCGVLDRTTASDTIGPLPANGTSSTATRYDLIVARFKWTDPTTPVAFDYIVGVPGANGPKVADLVRVAGTQYDAVLAVVRVGGGAGTLSPNDVFQLAPSAASTGQIIIPKVAYALSGAVDGSVGDTMRIADSGAIYRHNGTAWLFDHDTVDQTYTPLWTASDAATPGSIGAGALTGTYRRTSPGHMFLEILLTAGAGTQGPKKSDGTNATGPYRFYLPTGTTKSGRAGVLPGWFTNSSDQGPLTGFLQSGASFLTAKADQNNADIGNGLLVDPGNFLLFSGDISTN